MIKINFARKTYICPFCGHAQAYSHSYVLQTVGFWAEHSKSVVPSEYLESGFQVYSFQCSNTVCGRIAVTAINRSTEKQIDLIPQVVMKHYPQYIPLQIRQDYEEANLILEASPKAAATLLRRCLQGMIRDFWGISEKTLYAAISSLQDKVTSPQWGALDGLRKLGNIGAHMERDVNLIIDIDADEAKKLLRLIEMLLEKWYIARHDEEALCAEVTAIADDKASQRQ